MEELNILADFPRETITIVCSFARAGSLVRLALTCKYLQDLIADNIDYIVYHATDFRCFVNSHKIKDLSVNSTEEFWNLRNYHHGYGYGQDEFFISGVIDGNFALYDNPKYLHECHLMTAELCPALEAYLKREGIEKSRKVLNSRFQYTGYDIYDREANLFIDAQVIRCPIKSYKNVMSVSKRENLQVYLLACDAPNIRILCGSKELVLPKLFRKYKIYDYCLEAFSHGFSVVVNIMATKYTAHYNSKGVLTNLELGMN